MQTDTGKILVIDDDLDVLTSACLFLEQHFNLVQTVNDPDKIPELIKSTGFDILLLDMNFIKGESDGKEGLLWLKKIQDINSDIIIILMTAFGDVELAVKAIKEGAFDFILKPWKNAKLLGTILSAMKLRQAKLEVQKLRDTQDILINDIDKDYEIIIGNSPAVIKLKEMIEKVAVTDANILILGENGTGKELVARTIHRNSLRCDQVFISVDLGAISESLFESEIFGHVKGAFTDAKEDKAGRFELATGGTLFLDEIGNLSYNLQSKLLAVLQNRKINRIGSNEEIPINVRLICATNMPLKQMIHEKKFRQDLLYRINTIEVSIPTLRERIEDILLLVDHFLKIFKRKYNKPKLKIARATIKQLKNYSWPGNIREIKNIIERAVVLSNGNMIVKKDLALENPETTVMLPGEDMNIKNMERILILKAIKKNRGNITRAARDLGIQRNALYRRLEKYGL